MPELTDALALVDALQGPEPASAPRRRKLRPRKLKFDKEEVLEAVLREYKRGVDQRGPWLENHARWLAKYLGQIDQAEEGLSLHLPVLMTHIQRKTAELMGALFSGGRVVKARSRAVANIQREQMVEDFLNYQLLEELHLEEVAEKLALDFFVHGKFIAKIPWVIRTEGVRQLKKFPAEADLTAVLQAFYPDQAAQPEVEEVNEFTYKLRRRAPSAEQVVYTEDKLELFPGEEELEAALTREEVTWENPKVIRKRLEDIVVPNPDTLGSILEAAWIVDRSWLTTDEVKRLARDKVYDLLDAEGLEQVEDWESREEGGRPPAEQGTQEVSASQQGVETQEDLTGTRTGLTILECYWWWDVDGDGFKERVIFTIIEELRLLVRARYLSEVYRDNEWPFAEAGFIPTEGFYALGIPELAEDIQDALVVLHNQGLEWGAITNAPVGFYRPSSALKPETIRYRPGDLIPLDNPATDINFPNWPHAEQTWRFSEEALLNQYLQQALAQGPIQFGQAPEGRSSAFRSAKGTMAIIGQGDLLNDLTLRRFYRGLARIFKLVWRRDKEFLPPGRAFRIVGVADPGEDPFKRLDDREALGGDYDFELVGSNLTANKDFVRQTLLLLFQTLMNPFFLQTGMVGPQNLYEIGKELCLAFERRDFGRFLSKPMVMAGDRPKSPEEEHTLIAQGEPVKISPMENLQEHFQAHLEFTLSDAFGMIPPQNVGLMKAHMLETQQALLAISQAQPGLVQAAAAGQQQLQANPMVQGMLQGGLGAQMGPMPEFPAPGAAGPGGGNGKGGDSRNPNARTGR